MIARPSPRRPRPAALAVAAVVAIVAGVVAGATVFHSDAPPRTVASVRPLPPATTPPPTSTTPPLTAATQPTSPSAPAAFPSTDCAATPMAADSALGIGIPRPSRLASPGPEQTVFNAAVACLRAVGGRRPVLRTQLPIDVTRRAAAPDDEHAELTAFAGLLAANDAQGILSIRAHDFTLCGRAGQPRARQVSSLAAGQALTACEFPSPSLYAQLFTEISTELSKAAPSADLHYSAWNEPDHPAFTLRAALGEAGAARRAGEYWTKASAVVGADHVLAGEFADHDLPTLVALRDAFVQGAGGTAPPAWALHPYRDLTTSGQDVVDGFTQAVAPAPVWLTEVTPRLSGRGGIGGDAGAQRERGMQLRTQLGQSARRVVLYLLTPPPAPQTAAEDHWDSALADRQGRARPFVCGLAGLPEADCPGDPNTYGG